MTAIPIFISFILMMGSVLPGRGDENGDLRTPAFKRGVNIAGAEFGTGVPWLPDFCDENPGVYGKDYWFNSEKTFEYFIKKGLNLIRIPVRWERLQPVLSAPLNQIYLGYLRKNISWVKKHGGYVIIDIHNFGRYKRKVNGTITECIIGELYEGKARVKVSDFVDLWVRISDEFKNDPAVYAYGLMNEPHHMGISDWKIISQRALSAIRKNGDDKLIMVPGDGWSSAGDWELNNGKQTWIKDPENNFKYEAHCYFDKDNSGRYVLTYDEELALSPDLANRGHKKLLHFVNWCRKNNVQGYLGEYGVPGSDVRWREKVLENFLALFDKAEMGGTYWAAGEWWGDYKLSIQPRNNFTTGRKEMAVLLRHPGK